MGQQPPPNADPSTGLGTQAAAAGMPQQGGITGIINNPLLQGLLGLYGGIVGTPRQEGLGGAIKGGITGGLGLFNQAQLQQQEIPLRAAQLKEAQLQSQKLGMELRPLTADQAKGFDDWVNTLRQQQQADPTGSQGIFDPMELMTANLLQSQIRAQAISGSDVLKTLTAFKEAALVQAMAKRQMISTGASDFNRLFPQSTAQPPGTPPGQPPPAAAPPAATPQYKLPAGIKLGAGQQAQANVEGLGMTTIGTPDGTNYIAWNGKTWVRLQ